jgi:hypothetical protein
MIYAQTTKKKSIIVPQSVTASATTSGLIDTIDYDYAEFTVHMDSAATESNIPTELTISDGDTSTAFTAISALASSGDITIPTAVSSAVGNLFVVGVDLLKRKRWLRLEFSVGVAAATQIAADVQLSRGKTTASSAAERNVALAVNG